MQLKAQLFADGDGVNAYALADGRADLIVARVASSGGGGCPEDWREGGGGDGQGDTGANGEVESERPSGLREGAEEARLCGGGRRSARGRKATSGVCQWSQWKCRSRRRFVPDDCLVVHLFVLV